MARCEECLHYELCSYNAYEQAKYFGKDKEIYITIKNNTACKFFKPAADVAEVVRCKDCKHLYCLDAIDRQFYCRHHPQGIKGINIVEGNPFCSYGERKE